MAGKADTKVSCRICGACDEKDVNRLYCYRDEKQNIIWYVLCKDCEQRGEFIADTR